MGGRADGLVVAFAAVLATCSGQGHASGGTPAIAGRDSSIGEPVETGVGDAAVVGDVGAGGSGQAGGGSANDGGAAPACTASDFDAVRGATVPPPPGRCSCSPKPSTACSLATAVCPSSLCNEPQLTTDCPMTWTDAQNFGVCPARFLAHCGSYDGVFYSGLNSEDFAFYSRTTGRLVGHVSFTFGEGQCESFDPEFVLPRTACVVLPCLDAGGADADPKVNDAAADRG